MYRRLVKRRVTRTFTDLGHSDYDEVIARFHPNAIHWFAGDHALGGTRSNVGDIKAWYARWVQLLPDLQFEVTDVIVSGTPWNTAVAVEWAQTGVGDGRAEDVYRNAGVHLLHMRWGKTISQRVHCDTAALQQFLERLRDRGVKEASAVPIGITAIA